MLQLYVCICCIMLFYLFNLHKIHHYEEKCKKGQCCMKFWKKSLMSKNNQKKSTNAMFLFKMKLHILLVAIWQYYEKFKLTRIAHFSITNCFQRFFLHFLKKLLPCKKNYYSFKFDVWELKLVFPKDKLSILYEKTI